MVYINSEDNADTITAYLTVDFSADELDDFKRKYQSGACLSFSPLIHLKIVRAPEYAGKGFEYIRKAEDEAGREEVPFCLINEEAKKRGGIWYIGNFFVEDDVESEFAKDTSVVERILIKPEALALAAVNYDIANIGVDEDLDNCGMELPMTNESYQPQLLGEDEDGEDDVTDVSGDCDVQVTAEPGEFETSTDEKLLSDLSPKPDKVGRLKAAVAKEHGLVSDWTWIGDATPIEVDGTEKTFPEGSVVLTCRYDPKYPWPAAKWPEGSL